MPRLFGWRQPVAFIDFNFTRFRDLATTRSHFAVFTGWLVIFAWLIQWLGHNRSPPFLV